MRNLVEKAHDCGLPSPSADPSLTRRPMTQTALPFIPLSTFCGTIVPASPSPKPWGISEADSVSVVCALTSQMTVLGPAGVGCCPIAEAGRDVDLFIIRM